MYIYEYLFFKIFQLMKMTPGRKTAFDSTLSFLTVTLFLYTSSIILFVFDVLFGLSNLWIIIIIAVLYTYMLYKINKIYFVNKGRIKLINERFKDESKLISLIGYIISIFIILFSLVGFFLVLSIT